MTLLKHRDHDGLDDEDAGEILDVDQLDGKDGEPDVLGGGHNDDDVQGEDHPHPRSQAHPGTSRILLLHSL